LPNLAALDIDPAGGGRLAEIADRACQAQRDIDAVVALPQFADEEQAVYAGAAWDVTARRQRDAIIQPPRPQIVPARAVLARTAAVPSRDAYVGQLVTMIMHSDVRPGRALHGPAWTG